MAEGESILMSPVDSSDEALQLDSRTDEFSVINASSDSGDYETLIRTGCESVEHLNTDVSEVTQEARKVLEQFLKLSLGQSCVSSLEGHAWADGEPQYAVLDNIHKDSQPTPYQPMGSDQSLFENLEYCTGDGGKTIYQELTFSGQRQSQTLSSTDSPAAAVRQSSAPGRFCIMADDERTYMPLLIQKSEAGKRFAKKSLRKSSSSSMGDYEYSDTVITNRKRKSFLRLAKERLQRSFRREKKKMTVSARSLPASTEHRARDRDVRRIRENSPEKLRPSRARDVRKITYSSSSPYDVVEGVGSLHRRVATDQFVDTDVGMRQYMSETGYLTGETDDASKMDSLSPPLSKKLGTKSKTKKTRDIFGGILKQFRKSSQRPQSKTKEGKYSSKSTMNSAIIHTGDRDSEYLLSSKKSPLISKTNAIVYHNQKPSIFDPDKQRDEPTTKPNYETDVSHFVSLQSPSVPRCEETVQHERRSKMQLDGLVLCLPTSATARKELKTAGVFRPESWLVPPKREGRSQDEFDCGARDLKSLLLRHSSKPFTQKTEREKDELYEHIAGQLATIVYKYNSDSSPRSTIKPKEATEAAAGMKSVEVAAKQTRASGLESSTECSFQSLGGRSPFSLIDSTPVVAELVQCTSYSGFEQIVTSSIGAAETGWRQIGMMFRLTQSAIVMAGLGTAVALHIKEMTLKYFENHFANWIVTQGGWVSMVNDTNAELDSELE